MKNILLIAVILICASLLSAQNTQAQNKFSLIPYPSSLKEKKGDFVIKSGVKIYAAEIFKNEVSLLQQLMPKAEWLQLSTGNQVKNLVNSIVLQQEDSITAPEGYHLNVDPRQIVIAAKSAAGMFRAIQTIRQLLPVSIEEKVGFKKEFKLPAMKIYDAPAYNWRGMHLDVARHFFSIDYLKKFMDVMSLYKMNKFHLHLTDDQGWRIEIKKYPKLTEERAWRTFDKNDSACMKAAVDNPDFTIDTMHIIHKDGKTLYGGFYTQEQIKELVAYAASKHIDIIPEIDMPGHMMAAIHSYPDLSCEGGSKWGELFTTPICPCKESTFEFAENIFSEIIDLFPSIYIHLGADEVDKKSWAESADCKALMAKQGLKNVNELQSYFVMRMEKFFNLKGRKLIGWDEILEGGISSTATVMYWRSWVPDAPVKAAKNGNFVVMCPGTPLYFDNPEDAQSLENIYQFKVVPEKLSREEGKRIIGAQANIWTEQVPSENRADFLFMPRMTALAERLWSNSPDYTSYTKRLKSHFERLDAMKVHYRLPDLPAMINENVFVDSFVLTVQKPISNVRVRYTVDGSVPLVSSPELNPSLVIKKETTVKLAAFTKAGLRGDIYTLHYKKEKYAAPVNVTATQNGLTCSYYKEFFRNTAAMLNTNADSVFITTDFIVPKSVTAPSFGLKYNGYINIPETGIYTFYLTCDDGGILLIDGKETVNNDGLHSAVQKSGQVALQKGLHDLQLDFIEGGGGFKLDLKYNKGTEQPASIPPSWLKH